MPRYTICLDDANIHHRFYLCWSDVVDGPIFGSHSRDIYLNRLTQDLRTRHSLTERKAANEAKKEIARADERGVSSQGYKDVHEVLNFVRDGESKHEPLTTQQAITRYFRYFYHPPSHASSISQSET